MAGRADRSRVLIGRTGMQAPASLKITRWKKRVLSGQSRAAWALIEIPCMQFRPGTPRRGLSGALARPKPGWAARVRA